MDAIEVYKAGSLVVFSEGQYSDYGYTGHFVVLRDMTIAEMRDCAEKASKSETDSYSASSRAKEGFISELIRAGFLLDVNFQEIYIGAYGEIDEQFGVYTDD